jgi:hypothetical protein
MTTQKRLSQSADYYSHLMEQADPRDLYVFIPSDMEGGGKWIREDYFDDLPDWQYDQLMTTLEPFQTVGTSGFFSNIREKREQRQERRQARKDRKTESKATAREQRTAGGGALDKIIGAASNIFGGQKVDAGIDIQSGKEPTGYFRTETDKPFYTKPLFIGGTIVVVGGLIYFLTRPKNQ